MIKTKKNRRNDRGSHPVGEIESEWGVKPHPYKISWLIRVLFVWLFVFHRHFYLLLKQKMVVHHRHPEFLWLHRVQY